MAGVDLGGTNVRAAAVDAQGVVGATLSVPVDRSASGAPFAQLVHIVEELAVVVGEPGPRAVGLGATGPVDVARGVIDNPFTLPPALQGPVRDVLHAALGVPVAVLNDADAAALGEAWVGAGRGAEVVACLTVGTGIGVAVVRGLEVQHGVGGAHPEAGHHVVDPRGPLCYCGSHGCIESLASATAVVARAQEAGAVPVGATARDVFTAAAAGDQRCGAVVASAHEALVLAVRNLIAMYAPDVVVLAGQALGAPVAIRDAAQQAVDAFAFTPAGGTRVLLAELGDLAGCVGAARLALAA